MNKIELFSIAILILLLETTAGISAVVMKQADFNAGYKLGYQAASIGETK